MRSASRNEPSDAPQRAGSGVRSTRWRAWPACTAGSGASDAAAVSAPRSSDQPFRRHRAYPAGRGAGRPVAAAAGGCPGVEERAVERIVRPGRRSARSAAGAAAVPAGWSQGCGVACPGRVLRSRSAAASSAAPSRDRPADVPDSVRRASQLQSASPDAVVACREEAQHEGAGCGAAAACSSRNGSRACATAALPLLQQGR